MKAINKILKYRIITVVVAIMATTTQSYGQQTYSSVGTGTFYSPASEQQTRKASVDKAEDNHCSNEISIWVAGGLSTLNYTPEFGNRNNMAGSAFGIGYSYYWSKHFGFLLGAELALYQSKFNADGLQDNYNTIDLDVYGNPEKINFRYRLDDYEELQQLWNVNIPLTLQFQSNRFYAGAGFKLGIPVKANYKISRFGITSMGYYYDETGSHQVLDDVTELGFGEFSNKSVKSKLDLGLSYTGTLEAGLKWRLGSNTNLYTGIYFDYTFNDVVKGERDKQLVEYSSFGGNSFDKVNNVLASQYAPINDLHTDALSQSPAKSMASHVAPVAFGLKLRLGIGACSKNKQAEKEDTAEKFSGKKDKTKEIQAQTPEQARKAKQRAMISKSKDDEIENTGRIIPDDEDLKEELRRASSEYGASLLGVFNIEFEGYELNQSMLTPVKERMLDDKIAQIRKMYGTNVSIVCEGHTCDIGTDTYNMRLGKKRAEEVRKFLINRGFNPDKVIAISKGQYSPIVPNTSEANRKKNRRVVLIIRY